MSVTAVKAKEKKLLWVWVRIAAPLRSCLVTAALRPQDAVCLNLCAFLQKFSLHAQCSVVFFFPPCNACSHPEIQAKGASDDLSVATAVMSAVC